MAKRESIAAAPEKTTAGLVDDAPVDFELKKCLEKLILAHGPHLIERIDWNAVIRDILGKPSGLAKVKKK